VLFNEPKLLKFAGLSFQETVQTSFSALQRAEIAEMGQTQFAPLPRLRFSALQRAEIAEIAPV